MSKFVYIIDLDGKQSRIANSSTCAIMCAKKRKVELQNHFLEHASLYKKRKIAEFLRAFLCKHYY